jgi:hypothetical protein
MVDNNFKRQTSLIFLWSPFFILGLELVDKEIKRPPSLFSCGVLISHLVKKWSTTISRGIPLFFLVESLFHTWLRNGRQQYQEAFLFSFLWSPYFTLGLEMVDNNFKRHSSLFSCGVLTSHLVKKWSTKKSRGLSPWLSCEVLSSYLV